MVDMATHRSFKLTKSELPKKIWALRFQLTKRRITVLFSVILIYGMLWLVTCLYGAAYTRDTVIDELKPAPPLQQNFYCRTHTYAPFLVRVDYGCVIGSLTGGGGSNWYLWFFSNPIHLQRFDQIWIS
jgi:preprotein translocase subunit SecE